MPLAAFEPTKMYRSGFLASLSHKEICLFLVTNHLCLALLSAELYLAQEFLLGVLYFPHPKIKFWIQRFPLADSKAFCICLSTGASLFETVSISVQRKDSPSVEQNIWIKH